ncbi:hypothetical protein F5I97DRAFT_1818105 [Phlebopus sp. FC_14]|nr:hypothetical protein F5I97DRAFT_1818105 [Phlebopus sp. FC_14]
MSELDADLYGDLYGNDETEFPSPVESTHVKTEEKTAEAPIETALPSTVKAPPLKQEQPSITPVAQPIKVEAGEPKSYQEYVAAQSGSSSTSTLQQIPTYQQPQSSEYSPGGSASGTYDHSQLPERSVRPSEMKDEGAGLSSRIGRPLRSTIPVVGPSSSRLATQLYRLGLG